MYGAGLDEVVEHTKGIDLQEEEGVQSLGSIIVGMHTLLEHPHNQVGMSTPACCRAGGGGGCLTPPPVMC